MSRNNLPMSGISEHHLPLRPEIQTCRGRIWQYIWFFVFWVSSFLQFSQLCAIILLKYCNVGCKNTNIKGKMSTFAVCFNRICELYFLPKQHENYYHPFWGESQEVAAIPFLQNGSHRASVLHTFLYSLFCSNIATYKCCSKRCVMDYTLWIG